MALETRSTPGGDLASHPRHLGKVALIILCQSLQALVYGGIALFLPLIRDDLALSFTQAGAIGAASTIIYALMQIPSGYLADRIAAKRLFLFGLIGTNLLAYSFAHLHSYHLILANQALSGFFRSLLFAPGLMLITALFPHHRRATAMGLYVAGGFSSNVFLNTFGPLLVGQFGWRVLFTAFSLGGMLIILLFWQLGAPGPPRSNTPPAPIREVLALFRYRHLWLIGAIQYARLSVVSGLSFWLPSFLVIQKGYSLEVAGLLVALSAAVTAPSNFLGGYVSDRLRNPLLVIAASLMMLAITTVLLVHINTLGLLLVVFAVNGVFVQFYFGPLFAVSIQMLGPRRAGLSTGCGNFFANLGGVTFTYLLGAIRDVTGSFTAGLYTLSGLCLIALFCTVLLSRMKPIESQ